MSTLRSRSPRTLLLLLLCMPCLAAPLPVAGETHDLPDPSGEDEPEEVADVDTFYAIGVLFGRQISSLSASDEELDAVVEGLRAGARGRQARVEPLGHREEITALRERRNAAAVARERDASQAWLEEVATREGVVATGSGLLYEELAAGSGPSPDATDTVEVHYHGTLRDGTVFDSTRRRGDPARFPLSRVVPCWREGLQRMKVGGRARLVCPASLGYGDRGFPPRVPGGAALSFEIELLGIVEPSASQRR